MGEEGLVYEKTAFHTFFLANFKGKIDFSNPGNNWTYHIKPKKA